MSVSRYLPCLLLFLAPLCFASGLPKHAKLEVRLNDTLSSETSVIGDKFSATLDRDIALGDKMVLRKGAVVQGVVREAHTARNPFGEGELELELLSVLSDGKTYQVTTNPLLLEGVAPNGGPATRNTEAQQAAIGVIAPRGPQTIPGTNIGLERSGTGSQVNLPVKSKLTFVVTDSYYVKP